MGMRPLTLVSLGVILTLGGCSSGGEAEQLPTDGNPDTAEAVTTEVLQLEVGSCLMDLSTPLGQDLTDIPVIDCQEPHESEVYAEITLEGEGYPGVDAITEESIGSCMAEFYEFVGLDHSASTLDFAYYYPTPSSWAVGDRSVFCVVFDPGVLTSGTLENSRR